MTRFRKWILTAAITLALLIPLGSVASADPNDGGFNASTATSTRGPALTTTSADPNDGGW